MKKYIIPVIIPDSRQKKDWIFDNQSITKANEERIDKRKLEEIIEKHLNKINDTEKIVEIAFLGADFTNLEESIQE